MGIDSDNAITLITSEKRSEKRTYTSPKIELFGDIRTITLAMSTGGMMDSVAGGGTNMWTGA